MDNLIAFLHEFWVQLLTVLFMVGTILLAIFLGKKLRDYKDKKDALKETKDNTEKEIGETKSSTQDT